MVKVRQSTEELVRPALPIPNNNPPFPRPLYLEHLNHRPMPLLHIMHNLLVHIQRILRRPLQERLVPDGLDIRLLRPPASGGGRELTFPDEVAPELLGGGGGDGPGGTEGFEPVGVLGRGFVDE
jgi:hypothetical protein